MALNKILRRRGYPLLVQILAGEDDDSMDRGNGALHWSVSSAHAKLDCTARLGLKPGIQVAIRARLVQVRQVHGPVTVADWDFRRTSNK